ncbi:MAG: histidine phosphatase family protein [Aphanocapsa lilacina HA4352-LM1]|jgi:probable phosphoglycerate mutase|nr:histidine phosphatase family protein [Aphanocapsa lilacina HA4352-LM1]
MRVVLVRHGQSTWNAQGFVQGRTDRSVLTEAGGAQARATAAVLETIGFEAAFCSPLQRARQTMDLLLAGRSPVAVEYCESLMEIDLPGWEGLNHTQLAERFPQEHALWRRAPEKLDLGGFVPLAALWEQARSFWRMLLARPLTATVLVVAHNAINKALVSTALGLPPSAYARLLQSNTGISVLNFDAAGYARLESLNLTAHTGAAVPKYKQGTRLLLVRHGETEWNRMERFQGQIDVPLNDQGRAQAEQAAAFLKEMPITRAFSSPLLRPKATAEAILRFHPGVALELVPALQEICHGQWEGKFREEIDLLFPGELDRWQREPHSVQMPEGENLTQVWERATAAWSGIVRGVDSGVALVVAHDAINKAIVAAAVGAGPEDFWRFKQGNGSVTVIDYPDGPEGRPQLSAVNITSHLGGVFDCTAAGAL